MVRCTSCVLAGRIKAGPRITPVTTQIQYSTVYEELDVRARRLWRTFWYIGTTSTVGEGASLTGFNLLVHIAYLSKNTVGLTRA